MKRGLATKTTPASKPVATPARATGDGDSSSQLSVDKDIIMGWLVTKTCCISRCDLKLSQTIPKSNPIRIIIHYLISLKCFWKTPEGPILGTS